MLEKYFNVSGPRSAYNLVQTKIGPQLKLNVKFPLFTVTLRREPPCDLAWGI